jgi:hypothetical protein
MEHGADPALTPTGSPSGSPPNLPASPDRLPARAVDVQHQSALPHHHMSSLGHRLTLGVLPRLPRALPQFGATGDRFQLTQRRDLPRLRIRI